MILAELSMKVSADSIELNVPAVGGAGQQQSALHLFTSENLQAGVDDPVYICKEVIKHQ